MTGDHDSKAYILGHSDEELIRLERQSLFFAEQTADVLTRAGIGPGMHALDVGCGVGDVSFIAARMVGPDGTVTGLDIAQPALSVARRRAAVAGANRVTFEAGDLMHHEPGRQFDAVIGRFILLHMPDPAAALSRVLRHLEPGGIVAFVEMDIGAATAIPESPMFDRYLSYITEVYARVGLEPNMGSRLFATFRAAGLTPHLIGSVRVEGPWDSTLYEYFVESLRILSPVIEKTGIATREEIGLDTLEERLRAEALASDRCFFFPRVVGGWANVK
jgi:ubiquinone/menaquinone biosynthesis C-methylase UbiE